MKCDFETAAACVDRLYNSYEVIPGNDPSGWIKEMGNMFMRYEVEDVQWSVSEAIKRCKKRPSIAHLVEILDKRVKDDEDHKALIDRWTKWKPDPALEYKRVPKDDQTPQERGAFVEATLRRHGWNQIADGLKAIGWEEFGQKGILTMMHACIISGAALLLLVRPFETVTLT